MGQLAKGHQPAAKLGWARVLCPRHHAHTASVHQKCQNLSHANHKDTTKLLDFYFGGGECAGRGVVILTKNSCSALHQGLLQAAYKGVGPSRVPVCGCSPGLQTRGLRTAHEGSGVSPTLLSAGLAWPCRERAGLRQQEGQGLRLCAWEEVQCRSSGT